MLLAQDAVQEIIAEWEVDLEQFKGEFFETIVGCDLLCFF